MSQKQLHEARLKIAGFFKQRREELGISQEALAESTGLGRATIQRVEDAKFWPALKQYVLIADALGIDYMPKIK